MIYIFIGAFIIVVLCIVVGIRMDKKNAELIERMTIYYNGLLDTRKFVKEMDEYVKSDKYDKRKVIRLTEELNESLDKLWYDDLGLTNIPTDTE